MLTKQTLLPVLAAVLVCAFMLAAALPHAESLAQIQPTNSASIQAQPASAQPSALALDAVTYTYDDAGRLTGVDYGNGKSITYAYDAGGNLLGRTVTVGHHLMLPMISR